MLAVCYAIARLNWIQTVFCMMWRINHALCIIVHLMKIWACTCKILPAHMLEHPSRTFRTSVGGTMEKVHHLDTIGHFKKQKWEVIWATSQMWTSWCSVCSPAPSSLMQVCCQVAWSHWEAMSHEKKIMLLHGFNSEFHLQSIIQKLAWLWYEP